MKYITCVLFASILFSCTVHRTQHTCKKGYTCLDGIGTTSYIIEPGCYPDSIAKRYMNRLAESMCNELGFDVMSDTLKWGRYLEWNDSTGCIAKEEYKVLRGGKWVDISKKEFELIKRK